MNAKVVFGEKKCASQDKKNLKEEPEEKIQAIEFLTEEESEDKIQAIEFLIEEELEDNIKPIEFITEEEPKSKIEAIGFITEDEPENMIKPLGFIIETEPNEIATTAGNIERKKSVEQVIPQSRGGEFVELDTHLYRILGSNQIQIANFNVQVLRKEIHDDGVAQDERTILKLTLIKDSISKTISINSRDYLKSDWINTKAGIEYNLSVGYCIYEHLKAYISNLAVNVPVVYKYEHIGWRWIHSQLVFLHSNGAIGSVDKTVSGSKGFELEVDQNLSAYDAYIQTLGMRSIAKSEVSVPLMSLTILSTLKYIFESTLGTYSKIDVQTSIWLHGKSGTRKTSIGKVFTNIFNRTQDNIISSFEDTSAYLEYMSFIYKDCILLIDDYRPVSTFSAKKVMLDKALDGIRGSGDSKGKGRMTPKMNAQKNYTPRGLKLFTGENVISGDSNTSRIINIEVKQGDVNLEELSRHQNQPKVFSTCLSHFLLWVSRNVEKIRAYMDVTYRERRAQYQTAFRHGRNVESYILLLTAIEIFLEYGCSQGFLTNDQFIGLKSECQGCLYSVVYEHSTEAMTEDPVYMYLKAIQDLIDLGKLKLKSLESFNQESGMHGFFDDEYLYLLSSNAYVMVKEYWKRQDIYFPLEYRKTLEALEYAKVIRTSVEANKTCRTLKKAKTGMSSRFLHVKLDEMNKILNNTFE